MAHSTDERPHIRIYRDMLESEAYLTLPDSALRLLIDLRSMLTKFNNGMLTVTLSALKTRRWNSTDKMVRALQELERRGIVVCTKRMHANPQHQPSRFAFTDRPIPKQTAHGIVGGPATNRYRDWIDDKSAFRQTERNHSGMRKASLPAGGKRSNKTIPAGGKRENGATNNESKS